MRACGLLAEDAQKIGPGQAAIKKPCRGAGLSCAMFPDQAPLRQHFLPEKNLDACSILMFLMFKKDKPNLELCYTSAASAACVSHQQLG